MHSSDSTFDPDTLIARGIELQRSGKHADALEAFAQCLDAQPGHPLAHHLAVISNLRLGRWQMSTAHARAAAAADPGNAAAWCNLALAQRQLGRRREAQFAARRAVAIDPRLADAWIELGLLAQDAGSLDTARANMLRALEFDPRLANAHLALANLDQAQGRYAEALEGYAKAQALDNTIPQTPYSRGHLFHKATGDLDAAIASYRDAIATREDFAPAHNNLAHALFLVGRFAEAWSEHRWRKSRLQFEAHRASIGRPYVPPGSIPLPGSRLTIIAEQGLGDTLFFLRFAPRLRANGALLDFRGDPRLHAMLMRTGLFEDAAPPDVDSRDESGEILAGDLPLLLPEDERDKSVPALKLVPDTAHVSAARARLSAAGPAPYLGIAWRSGSARTGPDDDALLKELPIASFAAALEGTRATWISMQREPRPGEIESFASSLAAPVRDFSATNESLEESLAYMSVMDGYIGVSSTSVHLRASCSAPAHVLVPFPYEWRWMASGDSPWFPQMRVHRQAVDGSWNEAFARLAAQLR